MKTAACHRRPLILALLLAVLLALGACAHAPVQEMSNARQALKAAEASGALAPTSADYRAAEKLIRSAEDKLRQHSYRAARRDALEAKALAVSAMEAAEQRSPDRR
ncbi:MAG: hypothetical protein AAGD86_01485 [Pseudomonadota bacterium]